MRTAIISDIHANLEALEAVLRRIEKERVEEIVCLGDIVGYGPDPNACCALIREVCSTIILGNHDEWLLKTPDHGSVPEGVWRSIHWTSGEVEDQHKLFFSGLPLITHGNDCIYVHAAPLRPGSWEYITDAHSAARYFHAIGSSACFVGHSHLPGEYLHGVKNGADNADTEPSGGVIVNVGSVGQPRDGNPAACFVLRDDSYIGNGRHRFIRVDYDFEAVGKKIIDAGLPEFFAYRLTRGR